MRLVNGSYLIGARAMSDVARCGSLVSVLKVRVFVLMWRVSVREVLMVVIRYGLMWKRGRWNVCRWIPLLVDSVLGVRLRWLVRSLLKMSMCGMSGVLRLRCLRVYTSSVRDRRMIRVIRCMLCMCLLSRCRSGRMMTMNVRNCSVFVLFVRRMRFVLRRVGLLGRV